MAESATATKATCFNVTTPLKAWNAGAPGVGPALVTTLQCDHAVEGVECPPSPTPSASPPRFNVTTPLKAWNAPACGCGSFDAACFNVTTPLKAWNGGLVFRRPILTKQLQCDHAVEGVEWELFLCLSLRTGLLQCDHAVEGVECSCGGRG